MSLGIVVQVFKEDMGLVEFLKALRDMLSLYSNKVLKLLAKEHYKLQEKSVKMCSKEKMLETHGGEAVRDFAKQGAKALLHQAGRGSKRRQGQRSNLIINHKEAKTVFSSSSPKTDR